MTIVLITVGSSKHATCWPNHCTTHGVAIATIHHLTPNYGQQARRCSCITYVWRREGGDYGEGRKGREGREKGKGGEGGNWRRGRRLIKGREGGD